jgi:hypothetical protein
VLFLTLNKNMEKWQKTRLDPLWPYASGFAGQTSGLGMYSAQQYGWSKIGWSVEAPISTINSGLKAKK